MISPAHRARSRSRMYAAVIESLEQRRLLTFGLTTTSSSYTIDTGAQLVFSIARTAGSGSIGDLTSMKYNGTELEAPFATSSRYSHYESGLGSSTVVTATVDPNNQWILIACDDTSGYGVTQYYLAHKGDNNIYMATYAPGPNSPSPGEMRFITYTNPSVLTNIPAPSNNSGSTGAIESQDVFGHADGTTTSKYYGEYRAIDTQTYGLTGNGVGLFMNIGNRETSSGGPFFKDIDFQNNELYTYVFSGHSQTENFRPGLKGFYALQATNGTTPAAPDYSFIDTLGAGAYITGYVGAPGRGTVTGTAIGAPSTLQTTIALSNAADQYWATPDANTGAYSITGVQPGTYTETIYQGELEAGTRTVTITAGQITGANITNTLYTPTADSTVFRIGTWDGTPLGFLNADKITTMHPTDIRMSPWADSTGMTNFTVGTDSDSSFPMAEWHTGTSAAPYVDTKNRITFTLTAAQAVVAQTLRIGLTRLDNGRPTISVNSGAWNSAIPALTSQPNSRGLSTGNWRGNNCIYTFNIPTGKLVAGTNTIDISCVSGATGTLFSGYHIYDAIDLVSTSSITNAPVVSSITINPVAGVPFNTSHIFTAVALDQFGNVTPANFVWTATRGTIDDSGLYVAPSTTGIDTVTATANGITATYTFNVTDPPPTIATPAAATPNPAKDTSVVLSVLGADNGGESNLTYNWSTAGTPPAAVTFSVNGTNAAKSTTATFTQSGTYSFVVTVTDTFGSTVTSAVSVNVDFGALTNSIDMGGPATAGSLNYASSTGIYTVKGGGADIGSTTDRCRFSYANLAGNGTVIARVLSETNTSTAAKSGVMMRASTNSGAVDMNLFISPGGGIQMSTRSSTAGNTTFNAGPTTTFPVWLKIVRFGASANQFSAYYSTNGTTWTQVGTTQTLSMGSTVLAGLSVTSRNNAAGVLNTATFDNVAIIPLPAVQSVSINSNSAQRSRVTSVTVAFNHAVTLGSSAMTIALHPSSINGSTTGTLPTLLWSTPDSGVNWIVTFSGNGVVNGSIADGMYDITVNTAQVQDSSSQTMAASVKTAFTRLYGDINGDGTVNNYDYLLFKRSFGLTNTSTSFDPSFDFNGDGIVNNYDYAQFKLRFGTSLIL